MFSPVLGRNKDLLETLSRKQFRRKKRLFFSRRLRMKVSTKLPSRIFKILKNLKSLKIITKKYNFQKKLGISFQNFPRIGIYVEESCHMYMCTKFKVDVLKNSRALVFSRLKKVIFHAVSCHLCIFPIFQICPDWAVQKVF